MGCGRGGEDGAYIQHKNKHIARMWEKLGSDTDCVVKRGSDKGGCGPSRTFQGRHRGSDPRGAVREGETQGEGLGGIPSRDATRRRRCARSRSLDSASTCSWRLLRP